MPLYHVVTAYHNYGLVKNIKWIHRLVAVPQKAIAEIQVPCCKTKQGQYQRPDMHGTHCPE